MSQSSSPSSTVGSRSHSISDDGGDGGASEIATLARQILAFTEGDAVALPSDANSPGNASAFEEDKSEEELRKSVREALANAPPAYDH